jgi:hypothetical protein
MVSYDSVMVPYDSVFSKWVPCHTYKSSQALYKLGVLGYEVEAIIDLQIFNIALLPESNTVSGPFREEPHFRALRPYAAFRFWSAAILEGMRHLPNISIFAPTFPGSGEFSRLRRIFPVPFVKKK